MRHQIAAARGLAVEAVEADTPGGAAQITEHGRGAGEEIQIESRVDAQRAQAPKGGQSAGQYARQAAGVDGDHVGRGDKVEKIENGPIFREQQEVNVFLTNPLNRSSKGRLRQYRGSLLGQLDK